MGYYTNYDLSWDIPDEYPMNEEETADAIANYFGNLPYWRDGGYDFTEVTSISRRQNGMTIRTICSCSHGSSRRSHSICGSTVMTGMIRA